MGSGKPVERVAALLDRVGAYRMARTVYDSKLLSGVRGQCRRRAQANARRDMMDDGGVVTNEAGFRIHLDLADERSLQLYLRGGALNLGLVRLWSAVIDQVDPDLVLDIGANYGEVVFSRTYGDYRRVLAIEPNPDVFACLERTQLAFPDAVQLVSAAASHTAGTATLHVPSSGTGLASLNPEGVSVEHDSTEVATITIDSLVTDGVSSGSFVAKIDVEGHELAVLDGMRELFSRHDRYAVICEFGHLGFDELERLCDEFSVQLVNRFTLEKTAADVSMLADAASTFPASQYLGDVLLLPR